MQKLHVHVSIPRFHPYEEEKGPSDSGPFAWFAHLWARMHLNKARIWLVNKAVRAIQIV